MTTIQPRLVRADTLDLQSQQAPSAKDHTRSPTFSPYTHGATGSHHREALRTAEESAYHDKKSSPRLSGDGPNSGPLNHAHQYDDTDDEGDDSQQDGPGGAVHNDDDYDEGQDENDDDLEDDLLDKISSSPSIEDGKYSRFLWPLRVDSYRSGAIPASDSAPTRGTFLSAQQLNNLALTPSKRWNTYQVGHHLREAFYDAYTAPHETMEVFDIPAKIHLRLDVLKSVLPNVSSDTYADDLRHLGFPADDPVLEDNEDDDNSDADSYEYDAQDWEDEGEPWCPDESSSDDDPDDFHYSTDPRFIDFGWGGECLREIEDIDFEFVYALHTFVATVEGQANATKGDTMVLLDDSNSYWWLVRVVKDGSIGYLPAEHIETPTERLARLNKHRNIDLSASMLGDNPEKSKNPLKKAMRRRNAKTVAFAAPTYYEPSEYDYDTEDEEEDEIEEGTVSVQQQTNQQTENGTIQVGHDPSETHDNIVIVNGVKKMGANDQMLAESPSSPVKLEAADSGQAQQQMTDESYQRTRNGVIRNTDSFYKDDTVETKKISLTPRLLRNDTDSTANTEQDLRTKSSADTFDKLLGPDDKPKEKEKEKKKEKKGMLSGLFKRKDKGAKSSKTDAEEEKVDEANKDSSTKDSIDSSTNRTQSPERKPSKLQKHQQPIGASLKNMSPEVKQVSNTAAATAAKSPSHSPRPSEAVTPVTNSAQTPHEPHVAAHESILPEQAQNRQAVHTEKRSIFAPITTALKSAPGGLVGHEHPIKPVYSKRAKERFAIDGSDSEDDDTPVMSQVSQEQRAVSPMRDSQLRDSRPDSAMAVSPIDASDSDTDDRVVRPGRLATGNIGSNQPASHVDSHHTPLSDTASTSKPSPSLATHTPSTSRSTPTWSDASLRSYMESDQDIRDLLIIVHDKSNVTPVGPDHPLMGGLFMTERTRLAEMQTQLDSMLTTWITRKNPGLLAR